MAPAIYGVRETLKELRELDKQAQLACVREMKKAARPLAAEIERYIPAGPPLRGFANRGRTGWDNAQHVVKVKYGGRKRRNRNEWPLLSLRVEGAPTVMFDMAGRRSGNNLSSALSRDYGGASRAAWRPEDRLTTESTQAIEAALDDAMKKVNANLVKKPAGV